MTHPTRNESSDAQVEMLRQCRQSGQIDDKAWQEHCREVPGLEGDEPSLKRPVPRLTDEEIDWLIERARAQWLNATTFLPSTEQRVARLVEEALAALPQQGGK